MNWGGLFVLVGLLGLAVAAGPWGGIPIFILLAAIFLKS